MATPIIQSTQPTPGAGTPGEGRNDLVLSEVVTLSDTEAANAGASYAWVFEDIPIGSAAVLNNAGTDSPDFTPDVEGSYRIRCNVNGVDVSTEVLAVPLPNTGARIPSFDEELEYDASANAKGWHEAQDFFMRAVDAAIGSGGVGTTGEKFIDTINCGTVDTHDSDTPKRVHVFEFDPTQYDLSGTSRSLVFRAVAANGGGVASTNVRLRNLTDGDTITTLNFTNAAFTKAEAVLLEGGIAGQIDPSPKLYEVQIFVDAPDAVDDTINLGSAQLLVVNTVL